MVVPKSPLQDSGPSGQILATPLVPIPRLGRICSRSQEWTTFVAAPLGIVLGVREWQICATDYAPLVAKERLELSRVAPHDFESCVYTIPPLGHQRRVIFNWGLEISLPTPLSVFSLVIVLLYWLVCLVRR